MTEATFTAARLEDALALVKRSLGTDALIVSSRRLDEEPGSARFEVRAKAAAAAAAPAGEPVSADARCVLERVLLASEVPAAIARELTRPGAPLRSLREAREHLVRSLRAAVGFGGPAARARALAMVGPTGVGKTTTIAKLAARDALIERLHVVVISTDDYRIGGADQLERYADLIGIPFEVASDPASLVRALARHRGADRVYVDTAGRAPRDRAAVEAMAATLGQAGEPIAVHLCLPASLRGPELRSALARHAPLGPNALAITKLDEAACFGGIVVACRDSGLPLSWFSTGQRVPEDLEPASAERLADVLVGEEAFA